MSLLRRRMIAAEEKVAWYSDEKGVLLKEYGTYRLTSQSTEESATWMFVCAKNDKEWTTLHSNYSLKYPKNTNFIIEYKEEGVLIYLDDTRDIVLEKAYDTSKYYILWLRLGTGTVNGNATVNFLIEKI